MRQKKAIVTGAGGFIGSHLVKALKKRDYYVIGIDLKRPEFSETVADEFHLHDLREWPSTKDIFGFADELYMLAADMGGVGYINTVNAAIIRNSSLINLHSLEAAVAHGIKRVFFASSACVYPEFKQDNLNAKALVETDAIPAQPDTPYGWEKLFTEQACASYAKDFDLEVRIARFHNIFGPEGTYQGGREKSPAAICRKVALAKKKDSIVIWGDGKQERSYCYIDDCINGIEKLMKSDVSEPINIGSDRLVSIDSLVSIVLKIAQKDITIEHDVSKPQGVRSRNADITMAKEAIGWEPKNSLEAGLAKTYNWIHEQITKNNSHS
jgi:nucleoside-diphosphate-sugar epimerase